MAETTIGVRGCSLTSALVYSAGNNFSGVQIDCAALSSSSVADQTYHITLPEFLTVEDRRASLTVILHKLLLSSSSGICPQLPSLMSEILNDSSSDVACSFSLEPALVTFEEQAVLVSCLDTLDGTCALLDHGTSSLSKVADLVAVLSCEASGADTSAFNNLDSTLKDDAAVASDFRVLLNGWKLVARNDVSGVSCILCVHRALREEVRKVHSRTKVNLNSAGGLRGTKEAWMVSLSSLVSALECFGKMSLSRAQANVDVVADEATQSHLRNLLIDNCPTGESLSKASRLVLGAAHSEQYAMFLHLAHDMLGLVRTMVSWETAMAVLSLQSADLLRRRKQKK